MLSIDVGGCIYYRKWANDVKLRSKGRCDVCVGYKWKTWDEHWSEFWWRENNGFNRELVKCGRGR